MKIKTMKKLSLMLLISAFAACSNRQGGEVNADSSNIITDSSALKNVDTTSVIGANRIGQGQMRTDTPMSGSNVGK
jgi:hypothetical protein